MSEIRAMVRPSFTHDGTLQGPDNTARVYVVEGDALIIYDRGTETTPRDTAWLTGVLDAYGIAVLPAPEYQTEGELAGWRHWMINLAPRS